MNCADGQSGSVWFLAGSVFPGTVVRSCSVPHDKALFFPLLNAWADDTGIDAPLNMTVPQLQELAASQIEPVAGSLFVKVDGTSIPVTAANRGAAVFQYSLPNTDNLLQYFGAQVPGAGWPYGNTPFRTMVAPAVSDGYWMMVSPLSEGEHTIQFGGTATGGFTLDVTYHLTVN